jgi:hypothetical protein
MIHTLIRSAILLTAVIALEGQTTAPSISLAGTGYTLAHPAQQAAPGQLLLISLFGIKTSIPVPHLATQTPTGWPSTIDGITVELVQGNPPQVYPVEIRGIQQAFCELPSSCNTITGITLQVPFTLSSAPESLPYLRVSEGGQVVGAVLLRPVPDNVHVINTCDGTLIYISAAYSVPQDICVPVAMSNGKINSLYNLAHAGDAMSVWAYGLGALQSQAAPIVTPAPLQQPFQLNFDFRPNAPASRPVAGSGVVAAPLAVDYVGSGTYQINFVIPPAPSGLPACDGLTIKSNLTVTVSGPNSFDAAAVCIAP